jgi:hypothetical protein
MTRAFGMLLALLLAPVFAGAAIVSLCWHLGRRAWRAYAVSGRAERRARRQLDPRLN